MRLVTPLSSSALVAAALALAGCNLPQQYCDVGAECDESLSSFLIDPVPGESDDSAAVCAVNQQTFLNALRANSEPICHEIAAAWEQFMACAVQEGCDAFDVTEPECEGEYDDYRDLVDDAGNDCNP